MPKSVDIYLNLPNLAQVMLRILQKLFVGHGVYIVCLYDGLIFYGGCRETSIALAAASAERDLPCCRWSCAIYAAALRSSAAEDRSAPSILHTTDSLSVSSRPCAHNTTDLKLKLKLNKRLCFRQLRAVWALPSSAQNIIACEFYFQIY